MTPPSSDGISPRTKALLHGTRATAAERYPEVPLPQLCFHAPPDRLRHRVYAAIRHARELVGVTAGCLLLGVLLDVDL